MQIKLSIMHLLAEKNDYIPYLQILLLIFFSEIFYQSKIIMNFFSFLKTKKESPEDDYICIYLKSDFKSIFKVKP